MMYMLVMVCMCLLQSTTTSTSRFPTTPTYKKNSFIVCFLYLKILFWFIPTKIFTNYTEIQFMKWKGKLQTFFKTEICWIMWGWDMRVRDERWDMRGERQEIWDEKRLSNQEYGEVGEAEGQLDGGEEDERLLQLLTLPGGGAPWANKLKWENWLPRHLGVRKMALECGNWP